LKHWDIIEAVLFHTAAVAGRNTACP